MEVITAVIRPFRLNKGASALESIKDFPGMTVSDARDLCRQRGRFEQRKLRIDGFRENVFIEIVTPDEKARATRILDACDKLFRWGSATRGQLTAEQRERLNAMTLDEVIATLT